MCSLDQSQMITDMGCDTDTLGSYTPQTAHPATTTADYSKLPDFIQVTFNKKELEKVKFQSLESYLVDCRFDI